MLFRLKQIITRMFAISDRTQHKDRLIDKSAADGEQRLVGAEAFLKAFKDHGAVMYVVDLASFSIVDANEAALKFYGYDRATMLSKRIPDLNMTPELEIRSEIKKALAEERSYYIFKHRLSNGELRDVEIYANPITIRGKDYSFSIVHDITVRLRAEERLKENEEKYRSLFENAPDGVTAIDSKGYIVDCNTIDQTLIGLNKQEMIGNHITTYLSDESKLLFSKRFRSIGETGMIELESTIINKHGDIIPVWRKATAIYDNRGDFSGAIIHTRDITERKKMEGKLKHLAEFDNLTQIPNRQLFSENLKYAIAQAKRHNNRLALLFIDLDEFKQINDNYGHNTGDLLLKAVATRIQQQIRESDSIGRIGGDEFLVLLSNIEHVDNAMNIAEKICSVVDQPFDIPGYAGLKISSSIGVAIYPDHGTNDKQLIKLADAAMYKVKEGGRNAVRFYQVRRERMTDNT